MLLLGGMLTATAAAAVAGEPTLVLNASAGSGWTSSNRPAPVAPATLSGPAVGEVAADGTLKWRPARRVTSGEAIQPPAAETFAGGEAAASVAADQDAAARAVAPAIAEGREVSVVVPASHTETISPFADPFGDRFAQQIPPREPSRFSQPGPSLVDPDTLEPLQPGTLPPSGSGTIRPTPPPPAADDLSFPADLAPAGLAPANGSPSSPAPPAAPRRAPPPTVVPSVERQPAPREAAPPAPPAAPSLRLNEGPRTTCNRVYNNRNCCDEDSACDKEFEKVRHSPLSAISLDITPTIKPDLKTPEELAVFQKRELSKAPSRTWQDKHGNLVAEGRLVDFQRGEVHIRTADGGIKHIPFRLLGRDELCFVTAWWGLPSECAPSPQQHELRDWTMLTFTWKASGLCHKPLYFEEMALERYGHTVGPVSQPVISGAHFFVTPFILPYKMGISPPGECEYALGYYRPGSCAPYLVPPLPLSLRGAAYQAAAVAGGIWLLP